MGSRLESRLAVCGGIKCCRFEVREATLCRVRVR